jgi:hypothetical protein
MSSFEHAVRERTRAKYVIAVFGNVHECDDDFFRWFNEIFKRSLVNGKCRLTITPPEFIKGVRERRIFRNLVNEVGPV